MEREARGRRRPAWSPPRSRPLPRHAFAHDSIGAEDQHHDEQGERDEVAQLVRRGNADTVEKEGWPRGFDDSEEQSGQHCAGDAADAAEPWRGSSHSGANGCRERAGALRPTCGVGLEVVRSAGGRPL